MDDGKKLCKDEQRALFEVVADQARRVKQLASSEIEAELAAEQLASGFHARTGNHWPQIVQALASQAAAQLKAHMG